MKDFMDPYYRKFYQRHKEEFKIYEGLILTHPLYKVVDILKRKYNIFGNFKNNTFDLYYLFDYDKDEALKELDIIFVSINNYGYYCSYIIAKNEFDDNITDDEAFDINTFETFIDRELVKMKLSFEAKYDIEIEKSKIPQYLYHVTPYDYFKKIKEIGLIPRSRSKKAYHPERVSLYNNIDDTEIIAKDLYNSTSQKFNKWALLVIDTTKIPQYFRLFKDPNFYERAYYTLNNIPPYSITLGGEINF